MKTTIAIVVLSAGLLWGCQEKAPDQGNQKSEMNHDMSGGMNKNMSKGMNHDMSGGMNKNMSKGMDHDMDSSMNKNMSKGMDHDMDHDHGNMANSETPAYYTCPMESHKHINATEPGNCPECGMALVAAVEVSPDQADYFGCPMPMHSNIRSDEPGSCPECGMDLKPYKLEKTN